MSSPKNNRIDIDTTLDRVIRETETLKADVTTTNSKGTKFSYLSSNSIVKILRKHFKTNLKIERSFTSDGGIITYYAGIAIYFPQSKQFTEIANGLFQLPYECIKNNNLNPFDLSVSSYASEAALSIALSSLGVKPVNSETIPLSIDSSPTENSPISFTEEDKSQPDEPAPDAENEMEVSELGDLPEITKNKDDIESSASDEAATPSAEIDLPPSNTQEDDGKKPSEYPEYSEGKNGLSKLAYTRRCNELKQLGVSEAAALMTFLKRDRPTRLLDMTPAQANGLKNKINTKDKSYWEGLEDKVRKGSSLKSKSSDKKTIKGEKASPKNADKPKKTTNKNEESSFDIEKLSPLDSNLIDNEVMKARRHLKMLFRTAEDKVTKAILSGEGLPDSLTHDEIYLFIHSLNKGELKKLIAKF